MDFIPRNPEIFRGWIANAVTILTAHAAELGIEAADVAPLATASADFDAAVTDYLQKQRDLAAASSVKKTIFRDAVEIIRPLFRRVNNHPGMTDEIRRLLGLRTTNMRQTVIPIEEMKPHVVLRSEIGQVTVHWGTNPGNEHQNGKPRGVKGAIIYRKKKGEADFQIVGWATASPYYDEISGPGADYVYVVRYRGTRTSDLSPQSSEATIAASGVLAA